MVYLHKIMKFNSHTIIFKGIAVCVLSAFIQANIFPVSLSLAEGPLILPKPGVMVGLSPEFTPAYLKGITIHPENALKFDFIIHRGDSNLSGQQKQEEYKKLIKYFLASLAVPDENQWVNLSPYEKERIIKEDFGKTEMGRDLLSQDYLLKQITASLIYPEKGLGQKFWNRVYEESYKKFGNTNFPINTFNKVWIVPDDAVIYEKGNTAYVLKNHLKVMLEQDYLALSHNVIPAKGRIDRHSQLLAGIQNKNDINTLSSHIIREIILPALEKEVNEGKNFALLRQVYSGMILAAWYKRALKQSLLGKIYANKAKVKGVEQDNPKTNETIYRQYLQAFKKGVYNYIKEDTDKYTNQVTPRKYFSGGTTQQYLVPGAAGEIKRRKSLDPIDQAQVVREVKNYDDLTEVILNEGNKAMTADQIKKESERIQNEINDAITKGENAKTNHNIDGVQEAQQEVERLQYQLESIQQSNPSGVVMTAEEIIKLLEKINREMRNAKIREAIARNRVEVNLAQRDESNILHQYYDLIHRLKALRRVNKILLVDNDPIMRKQTRDFLSQKSYLTLNDLNVETFLRWLFTIQGQRPYDLIAISSQGSEDMSPVNHFNERIFKKWPDMLSFYYSGKDDLLQKVSEINGEKSTGKVLETNLTQNHPQGKLLTFERRSPAMITPGGIDMNAAHLNLQIRRDGRGVPLPVGQQDIENINIDSLVPIILDIKPALATPLLSELQVFAAKSCQKFNRF